MKELIYTAIFVVLGIVLLLLLIFMFSEDHSERTLTDLSGKYTARIYTASMTLGGSPVEIAVTVDRDYISSITFHQLDETVAAMYPLMEPALRSLCSDLRKQSAEGCLLFRRQPVYLHDAHGYHPHCSGKAENKRSHSRKSYLREWPSLQTRQSTAPAIIKKSDRLNTSSFNRFHGEWKRI